MSLVGGREQLVSIQVLRGIAATAVVFYHVHVIGKMPENLGTEIWVNIARPGLLGVNLFFVLSGFIILNAHEKDVGMPAKIKRFVRQRVTRIYPIYWILTLAYVAAALLGLGDPDFTLDPLNVLSTLTLFEFKPEVALPLKVAWTLFFEMKFYLMFALLIINRRLGLITFAAHAAYILIAQGTNWTDLFNMSSLWHLHFFVGMGAFLLTKRLSDAWMLPMLAIGVVGIVWYIWMFNYDMSTLQEHEHLLWVLAPAFGALLIAAVLAEPHFRVVTPSLLTLLGNASYSVYLVHSAVISVAFIILRKVGLLQTLPVGFVYVTCFVGSMAAGIMIYLVLERPLLRLARRPPSRSRAVPA